METPEGDGTAPVREPISPTVVPDDTGDGTEPVKEPITPTIVPDGPEAVPGAATIEINPEGDGPGPAMATGQEQAVPNPQASVTGILDGPAISILKARQVLESAAPLIREIASNEYLQSELAKKEVLPVAGPVLEKMKSSQDTWMDECEKQFKEEIEEVKQALGLPAMQTELTAQKDRLQKLIDVLKAQGGILHEEI